MKKRMTRIFCLLTALMLCLLFTVSCGRREGQFRGGERLTGEELKRLHESLLEASESEEQAPDTLPEVVYWFDGGSVWHADPACGYLKNHEELCSGTPDDALAAGIERGCSRCGKR